MKPYRLFVLLAVAALVGASSAHADGACSHTNLIFYTTDTTDLAKGLGAAASSCADYYVSISPITAVGPDTGKARGGAPLTTIHAQGPQFHALAEVRLPQWSAYAQAHGWEAAGQAFHDSMIAAGYDPARDTWAVNEVGTPSNSTVNTDIFDNAPASRDGFRLFVKGLSEGASRPPMAGLVFAANPPQLAPDLAAYERGLAAWYADAPFWQDMQRYVRFWAQETYSDVRAWGVAGSSLGERTSYLNDYFLHGLRMPGAAHDFLTSAYVPVGNASWRQLPPVPASGPGFGSTDVPLTAMKAFVSAQTYALRASSGAGFGYAVVPKNPPSAADRQGLEAYLGSAIRASQSDPTAACAAGACDANVDGAVFTNSWRTFATPPLITPHVLGPRAADGWYTGDVTVSWDVSDPQTGISSSSGCDPAQVTQDTAGTTVTCTATSSGGTTSEAVTVKRDTTAPTIVARVDGPHAADGWYTGDVSLSWDVSDSLSPISSTDGCDTVHVTEDTAGTTFTCTATSDGGTASPASVTIKRDTTPPVIVPHVTGPQSNGWYTGDVTVSWDVTDSLSPTTVCETTTITQDTAGTLVTCTATSDGGTSSASVTIKRDTTPPVIVPHVTGSQSNGWYTGDVTVSWDVTDSLSPTSTCESTTITQDTSGTLVTCTARSDGGTSSVSVTIRRDTTAPTVTCAATPSRLWPPNGKLVPVSVAVHVADATSGAGDFVLASAPAEDASGWDVGTPDVSGLLRAQRPGSGGDRVYTLTYTARDVAGNTATCDVTVTVPHDQRG